jgi:hypothetical protein
MSFTVRKVSAYCAPTELGVRFGRRVYKHSAPPERRLLVAIQSVIVVVRSYPNHNLFVLRSQLQQPEEK